MQIQTEYTTYAVSSVTVHVFALLLLWLTTGQLNLLILLWSELELNPNLSPTSFLLGPPADFLLQMSGLNRRISVLDS